MGLDCLKSYPIQLAGLTRSPRFTFHSFIFPPKFDERLFIKSFPKFNLFQNCDVDKYTKIVNKFLKNSKISKKKFQKTSKKFQKKLKKNKKIFQKKFKKIKKKSKKKFKTKF